MDEIRVKGARMHNLKNISVNIPRNKLTVITGLSGSGKSSLAFDTIFAEGQRRYVESLSAYARQFIAQMEKPEVESIEGLSPAISIDQKSATRNPRSTVGTVTEIFDYMRLLWAKVGHVHCSSCGRELQRQTASNIVQTICDMPEGSKILLLAPLVVARKGEHIRVLEQIRREGFVRMRIDGQMVTVDEDVQLDPKKHHTIEIVIDRLVLKDMKQSESSSTRNPPAQRSLAQASEGGNPNPNRSRLADSVELALKKGNGTIVVGVVDDTEEKEAVGRKTVVIKEEFRFCEAFVCPDHPDIEVPQIEPRSFSFNSPHGACPECHGLGTILRINVEKILPNETLTIAEGAIHPWATSAGRMSYTMQMLEATAKVHGFSVEIPWNKLKEEHRKIVLYGSGETIEVEVGDRGFMYETTFEGVIPNLERRYRETESSYVRSQIEDYMEQMKCNSCHGSRLRKELLGVTVGNRNIIEATHMPINDVKKYFEELSPAPHSAGKKANTDSLKGLSDSEYVIAKKILHEILNRLGFLANVGLTYLTLDRSAATLSGGEAQRIRLATQIGSALEGVLYVLDEPSIGLHQRDNARLIATMESLRDLGNTVIVVEHDEETMERADYILEIGPGAGKYGGEVIAQGTVDDIKKNKNSVTGQYLSGAKSIAIPKKRHKGNGKSITIAGATHHNLHDLTVTIPLGCFIGVTGVSGSGKSSLINGILAPELLRVLNNAHAQPEGVREVRGLEHLDKAIVIDQSPIGRTPRSNPATYSGVFTEIREIFSVTPEAKLRGYKPGRFSFNVKGGRCEECEGDGLKRIEMHFLSDIYVTCEACHGQRYNRETLEVTYRGKNVAEALNMTVTEGLEFFSTVPQIARKLQTLQDVGLGYIHLGQSATTLSGGEAQRVKLATELTKRATGKTFYILDEPTTGLHFDDIKRLLEVLNRLVQKGNTVLVIEHNLDVIKSVDHIIDLGPDGGEGGGNIIAEGTPEEVACVAKSYTGQFLQKVLAKK